MKVQLSTGEAQIGVKYGSKKVKVGEDKPLRAPGRPAIMGGMPCLKPGKMVMEPVLEDGKPVMEQVMTGKGEKRKPLTKDGKPVMQPKMKPVMIPAPVIEQRTTQMKITLATGQEVAVEVAADTGDQFSYAAGRYAALLAIFQHDTEAAQKKMEQQAMGTQDTGKQVKAALSNMGMKVPSLMSEAKKFYLFPREDRTTLFRAICRSFYQDAPDRVEQRERALLAKLKAKYPDQPPADELKKAAK